MGDGWEYEEFGNITSDYYMNGLQSTDENYLGGWSGPVGFNEACCVCSL